MSTTVTDLQSQLKDAQAEVRNHGLAMKQLSDAFTPEKVEKVSAYKTIKGLYDAAIATVDRLTKRVEAEQRAEATKAYMDPIIAAFGSVKVPDNHALPSVINVADIEVKMKAAKEARARAESAVIVYDMLTAAIISAKVPVDSVADLRPLHIKPGDGGTVTIEVGTRTGGGGGRSGGARAAHGKSTILKSSVPDLVGKTVGKDCNFSSWRDVLQTYAPEKFAELEAKRAQGSNFSAAVVSTRLFDLEIEKMDEEPATAAPAA